MRPARISSDKHTAEMPYPRPTAVRPTAGAFCILCRSLPLLEHLIHLDTGPQDYAYILGISI
jgi:hypothetical protein